MNLTLDQRIFILGEYKRKALEIFENYKYLLTNPELELHFELGDPNIQYSILNETSVGSGLAVVGMHCIGCIILMLDVVLDSALYIIDKYTKHVNTDEKKFTVIWHTLEHVVLHEMQHAGQPFHLLNVWVDASINSLRKETDADYVANKILMEDFGAPEWYIQLMSSSGYGYPMMLTFNQSQLRDVGLYYYEFIKTFFYLTASIRDNNIVYWIQEAIFNINNLYIRNTINDKDVLICIKRNGVFLQPTREFCHIYNIAFLGISEPERLDKDYMITINAKLFNNDDDSIVFTIGGKRLIPAFTKDLARYYNA